MADLKPLARAMYHDMAADADVDALIDEYIAEDFVEHEQMPGLPATREAPRQMFKMFQAAFPDFEMNVEDLLQDGDKIAARITFTGTHRGDFMGVPATGNKIEVQVIDILQFRGDKAVAHWGVTDVAAMMIQMGVMEPPG